MQINIDDPSLPYGVDLEEIGVEGQYDYNIILDNYNHKKNCIISSTRYNLIKSNKFNLINFK